MAADLIPDKEVKALVEIYQAAERRILAKLNDPNLDISVRTQKESILQQISNQLKQLEGPTNIFFDEPIQEQYQAGIKTIDSVLKQLEPDGYGDSSKNLIPVVDTQAARAAAEMIGQAALSEAKSALNSAYQNLEKQMNFLVRDTREKTLRETGSAIITGDARKQLSNRLAGMLKEKGVTGYSYENKNGQTVNMTLEAYVKGLALTTLRTSRLSGTVQRATDRNVELLKFSSHPKPSPMCAPYQHRVVSISGKNPDYPSLQDAQTWYNGKIGMMNHTFCRHTALPYIETGIQFVGLPEIPKNTVQGTIDFGSKSIKPAAKVVKPKAEPKPIPKSNILKIGSKNVEIAAVNLKAVEMIGTTFKTFSGKTKQGSFSSLDTVISLSTNANHPKITIEHEIGHSIDYYGHRPKLAKEAREMMKSFDTKRNKLYVKHIFKDSEGAISLQLKTIKNEITKNKLSSSQEFKKIIRDLNPNGFGPHSAESQALVQARLDRNAGTKKITQHDVPSSYLLYLYEPEEIFADGWTQYHNNPNFRTYAPKLAKYFDNIIKKHL